MVQAEKLIRLAPGTIIRGKWSRRTYQVDSLLGHGGCGFVYLVKDLQDSNLYALKVSWEITTISREYQVLKELNSELELRRFKLVPRVYHLDDLCLAGNYYPYLLMEYVRGVNLQELLKKRLCLSCRETVGIGLLVALALEKLHYKGYIYGDLKLENLIYNQRNGQIAIIDFGGTGRLGESVKTFTPVYDRASWGQGERKGDYLYDLFAFSMLLFILASGKVPTPKRNKGIQEIFFYFSKQKEYIGLKKIIRKGLEQRYQETKNISQELLDLWENSLGKRNTPGKVDIIINFLSLASLILLIFSLLVFYS